MGHINGGLVAKEAMGAAIPGTLAGIASGGTATYRLDDFKLSQVVWPWKVRGRVHIIVPPTRPFNLSSIVAAPASHRLPRVHTPGTWQMLGDRYRRDRQAVMGRELIVP